MIYIVENKRDTNFNNFTTTSPTSQTLPLIDISNFYAVQATTNISAAKFISACDEAEYKSDWHDEEILQTFRQLRTMKCSSLNSHLQSRGTPTRTGETSCYYVSMVFGISSVSLSFSLKLTNLYNIYISYLNLIYL